MEILWTLRQKRLREATVVTEWQVGRSIAFWKKQLCVLLSWESPVFRQMLTVLQYLLSHVSPWLAGGNLGAVVCLSWLCWADRLHTQLSLSSLARLYPPRELSHWASICLKNLIFFYLVLQVTYKREVLGTFFT